MRRLLVELDDELDPWLAKYTNQSEEVRKALRLYKGDMETGTREGMARAFMTLYKEFKESQQRSIELYDLLERAVTIIEELANR